MFLMIDNFDSFVYNLVRYLEELNEQVMVVRNNKITIEDIREMNIDGIIISPGPKEPQQAGISLDVIEAFKGRIPILGICLGHQAIGQYFGGKILKGKEPVHGKISEVIHIGSGVFKDIKSPLKVTRYHSLVVDRESLPDCLEVTCETEEGTIMGLRHRYLDIEGVQFHPEAELTECGHEILRNFIRRCKSGRYNG